MIVELLQTASNTKAVSVFFEEMIKEKIRENEAGIFPGANEEDIEIRENNIRRLQKEWQDFRSSFGNTHGSYTLRAELAN
jgi:hypothetical protein